MTTKSVATGWKQRLQQLLSFAAVGATATAIQYAVLAIGVEVVGTSPTLGSGAGFVISASANYLLNYRLTFRSTRAHSSAVRRFAVVAAVGLLLNLVIMKVLTGYWHVEYLLAQVVATAVVFCWTFVGSARWSFAAEPGQ